MAVEQVYKQFSTGESGHFQAAKVEFMAEHSEPKDRLSPEWFEWHSTYLAFKDRVKAAALEGTLLEKSIKELVFGSEEEDLNK